MNILLFVGLSIITAYLSGHFLERMGIPKIVGYLLTGILFSPNALHLAGEHMVSNLNPLLDISLAFIAFEVGGELKWKKIKKHGKQIIAITVAAAFVPLIFLAVAFYALIVSFPDFLPQLGAGGNALIAFVILLSALASPTDPTATLGVIHEYKSRGKVTDTILGVVALDDALGILLYSFSVAAAGILIGESSDSLGNTFWVSLKEIGGGILLGALVGFLLNGAVKVLKDIQKGQWIVLTLSAIALCYGVAKYYQLDGLLACLLLGLIIVNTNPRHRVIFSIIEDYTEELIFIFFFVLSGLHLNISALFSAIIPIIVFVSIRILGKYSGTYLGGVMSGAAESTRKHTAGGLFPQGGVVIGLALLIQKEEAFTAFADLILTIVMGAVILNEIIGPYVAKFALKKAGEINR